MLGKELWLRLDDTGTDDRVSPAEPLLLGKDLDEASADETRIDGTEVVEGRPGDVLGVVYVETGAIPDVML